MAKCNKCGAELAANEKFCGLCGAAIDFTDKAAQTFEQINNTADTTAEFTPEDINQNKAMAILAYIIFLIPLFAAKESKFARFHTNQGLVLVIFSVAYAIVEAILSAIFYAISWSLGALMGTILGLVFILVTVLAIIGIVNAAQGKAKELPLIGKIQILK